MRRACYFLGLLGCGLWYLLSGSWLSWVLLFHIPVCCLPCSWVCFRQYLKLKHDAAK